MEYIHSVVNKKDVRYCPYHKERPYAGTVCYLNISDLPFSKHCDKGKGQMMMNSHRKMEIEKDEQQAFKKGEPNLDFIAQQALNLFKFEIFY